MKRIVQTLAAATCLAGGAHAATVTGASLGDGTETVAGVTITAQAGTFEQTSFDDPDGTGVITLTTGLDVNDGGLGVDRGFFDSDDVDGFGPNDIIVFSFSQAVTLNAASFASFDGFLPDEFVLFAGDDLGDLTAFTEFAIGDRVALDVVGRVFGIGARSFEDDFVVTALDFAPVPIPGAAALMITGLGGLGLARRRAKAG